MIFYLWFSMLNHVSCIRSKLPLKVHYPSTISITAMITTFRCPSPPIGEFFRLRHWKPPNEFQLLRTLIALNNEGRFTVLGYWARALAPAYLESSAAFPLYTFLKTLDLESTPGVTLIARGETMKIAQVSERYAISSDTLRYYERIGLIPTVNRNESSIRDYTEIDESRVEFI